MSLNGQKYLLPAGLADVLPPHAAEEAALVERLMSSFTAWGYDRVKPPLIEFEDSLLSGLGEAMSAHTFRLMDPVSQRMMGLRADMTPQISRIAASRLKSMSRPLRLSYAGQVLRVKGEQMRPDRQIGQAGVELIGVASAAADAEMVILAADALGSAGVPHLAIDLNIPTLTSIILREAGLEDPRPLILALDRKDVASVRELAGAQAPHLLPDLEKLLAAVGPVETAIPRLLDVTLPAEAAAQRDRLVDVARQIRSAAPDLPLTIDPTDHRGFEYHSGITFSMLGRHVAGEFGRGGRYVNQAGEQATGFTLYLGAILDAIAPLPVARRVYLPLGTDPSLASRLRAEGWITVCGLTPAEADGGAAEAGRLRCDHLLRDGTPVCLTGPA